MQFLIDTATDNAVELYLIGRFLVQQFEVVPVPVNTAGPLSGHPPSDLMPPPPPPPPTGLMTPLPQIPGMSDDDPEVEFDAAGNVTAVTVSTELPAAPPPPPPVVATTATAPAVSPAASTTVSLPPATPAPPGPAVPAELDSRGMPWDARIHASNRSKTIKNEWKRKRGVDENLVAACEAQNKPGNAPSVMPIAATAPAAPAATVVSAAVPAPPVPTVAASAPPPPPPPSVTPGIAAPAAVAPSAIDFRGLMQKIQKATADGKLTADQVNAALAGIGLRPEEMAQLINNAPLIASVNAAVDACLA